jgi:hypothetical protein
MLFELRIEELAMDVEQASSLRSVAICFFESFFQKKLFKPAYRQMKIQFQQAIDCTLAAILSGCQLQVVCVDDVAADS